MKQIDKLINRSPSDSMSWCNFRAINYKFFKDISGVYKQKFSGRKSLTFAIQSHLQQCIGGEEDDEDEETI